MNSLLDYIRANFVPLLIIISGVAFFIFVSITSPSSGLRKKVGRAEWATPDIIRNAKRTAQKQMTLRKKNSVALYVNLPHKKDDQNTIWIPDVQRGTIVVGAPGSGKTFSFIDPMLRSAVDQGFPICLYDFKYPSQASTIAAYALAKGYRISCFCPGFPESQVVNLLDFMRDENDAAMAKQMAEVLTSNLSDKSKGGGNDDFFKQAGDQLITGVFQLAKLFSDVNYADVLMCQKMLVSDRFVKTVKHALDKGDPSISKWIGVSFDQVFGVIESEKTLASIVGMAQALFTRFADPTLLMSLCGKSTLDLDLTGRKMIIFGMDGKRREVIKPILATVIHMVMAHNLHPNRSDPIILALDEFPTLTLPAVANWLNECRSYGFCGILGLQTLNQMEKTYGKEMSGIICTGANTKVIFNPGDFDSAKKFSDYLGQEDIVNRSVSRSVGKQSSSTYSEQDKTRALLAPENFLTLPSGTCVFINPAYASKNKAYVPARFRVKINHRDIQFAKNSEAQWPMVKVYLILHKIINSINLPSDLPTEVCDTAVNYILNSPDLVSAILKPDSKFIETARSELTEKLENCTNPPKYLSLVQQLLEQDSLLSPATFPADGITKRQQAFSSRFPKPPDEYDY